jgi:hypothetical protein
MQPDKSGKRPGGGQRSKTVVFGQNLRTRSELATKMCFMAGNSVLTKNSQLLMQLAQLKTRGNKEWKIFQKVNF